MTPEQQAAYVNAQAACAILEALGMISENIESVSRQETIPHSLNKFKELIYTYGIGHNAVLTLFQGR